MCVLTSPVPYCSTQEALGELVSVWYGFLFISFNRPVSLRQLSDFFLPTLPREGLSPISSLSPTSSRPRSKQLLRTQAPISPAALVANSSQIPFQKLPSQESYLDPESLHKWPGDATSCWDPPKVPLKDQQPRRQLAPRLWLHLVQLLFLLNPTLSTSVRCSS